MTLYTSTDRHEPPGSRTATWYVWLRGIPGVASQVLRAGLLDELGCSVTAESGPDIIMRTRMKLADGQWLEVQNLTTWLGMRPILVLR
jgi:hypothetical protein